MRLALSKRMGIYHLNDEQKELLEEFAQEAMDNIMCDLADDVDSPLDPYDQTGNYDQEKMKAMMRFVADEIRSRV